MFRYLAFIWNRHSQRQQSIVDGLSERARSIPAGLRTVVQTNGLLAMCSDIREPSLGAHLLKGATGVVFGTLFERSGDPFDEAPARLAALDAKRSDTIAASEGQRLITDYWGNYVAVITSSSGAKTWVIKDPSGPLPCFTTLFQDVHVVFSFVGDCLDLGLPLTVNRQYLREYLIELDRYYQGNTLNEVSQLRRGETLCIEYCSEGACQQSRKLYWTPTSYPRAAEPICDPNEAARAMAATTRSSTAAHAQCHDRVLVRLSGGLDSSIIAGCLARTVPQANLVTYTYHNPRGRSDERVWARMVADHVHSEHIECPLDASRVRLERMRDLHLSVEPSWGLQYLERTPLERRLSRQSGTTAIFSGDGGDSGFGSDSIDHVVVDYLNDRGLDPNLLWLSAQLARRKELLAWRVAISSLRKWWGHREDPSDQSWKLDACRLLSSDLRAASMTTAPVRHPWLEGAARRPSLAARLGTLLYAPEFYDLSCPTGETDPEVVHPLYSQPVIELFLRIPLYVHFERGRDRGLARRAFAGEVPDAILLRQWKDRGPGFAEGIVLSNLKLIRETLLDGLLMKEGLLDRKAVEESLSEAQARTEYLPVEILRHFDTEMWIRRWQDRGEATAAAA